MYRPESTCLKPEEAFSKDLNLVYWSDDLTNVELPQVRGKCFLQCETSLTDGLKAWTDSGEFRFYYNMAYDKASKTIKPLPAAALKYKASTNSHMKGNGKGKGRPGLNSLNNLSLSQPVCTFLLQARSHLLLGSAWLKRIRPWAPTPSCPRSSNV